jgi:putative redox protein
MKANLSWVQNMQFRCDNHGVTTLIDALPEHGGSGQAATPKELVLNAMMGCTAMDVLSILKKMRQEVREFNMEIEAEKTSDHPVHFKSAEMIYDLHGSIDPEKAIKAVDSSLTKYCGVNYMISKTCKITFSIKLNGNIIKQGPVIFTVTNKG